VEPEPYGNLGNGNGMHYGSGSETGMDPDPTQKLNKKVKKSKLHASFQGNNAASDNEKARFCTNVLLLENFAKYYLDPEPELDTEPEPESKIFQSRKRNRIKLLRFHSTAGS
jgi:hypothetical protein